MPFGNLSGQFISQSFQVLVQADTTQNPVTFADGLGNNIGIMTNAQTSSFLTSSPFTATAISGAFNGQTGSFLTELPDGIISSSADFVFNSVTSSMSVATASFVATINGGSF